MVTKYFLLCIAEVYILSFFESRLALWLALTKRMWRSWPSVTSKSVASALPLLDWLDCHKKTGYPATSAKWRRAESPADGPASCPARLVRQSGTTWSQQRLQVHEWPLGGPIQSAEMSSIRTSLVVQCLRLCLAMQGALGRSPVRELDPTYHN